MTLSGHQHVIPVIFQTICLSIAMVRLFDSYRKIFPQLSKGFTIAIERLYHSYRKANSFRYKYTMDEKELFSDKDVFYLY